MTAVLTLITTLLPYTRRLFIQWPTKWPLREWHHASDYFSFDLYISFFLFLSPLGSLVGFLWHRLVKHIRQIASIIPAGESSNF